jgi:hypothetical protein
VYAEVQLNYGDALVEQLIADQWFLMQQVKVAIAVFDKIFKRALIRYATESSMQCLFIRWYIINWFSTVVSWDRIHKWHGSIGFVNAFGIASTIVHRFKFAVNLGQLCNLKQAINDQ